MDIQTEKLIDQIVAGLQEKKGHDIVVSDFSEIDDAICRAFIIATGNSPSHVQALSDSVENFAREHCNARPAAVAGRQNAQWVAMDFGDIIVHIFLAETRAFYDLEHLWADAALTEIPDIV